MAVPKLMDQLGPMFREAVRDIRSTVHEVAFGKAEHAPEQGTPMNPTPQMVTQELGQGYNAKLDAAASRPEPEQEQELER